MTRASFFCWRLCSSFLYARRCIRQKSTLESCRTGRYEGCEICGFPHIKNPLISAENKGTVLKNRGEDVKKILAVCRKYA